MKDVCRLGGLSIMTLSECSVQSFERLAHSCLFRKDIWYVDVFMAFADEYGLY